MSTAINKQIKEEYEARLKSGGPENLYKFIVGQAVISRSLDDEQYPEVFLLNQSDNFFSLFRTSGKDEYFTIGKVLRKAAHKLYRLAIKSGKSYPRNKRFLSLVKNK